MEITWETILEILEKNETIDTWPALYIALGIDEILQKAERYDVQYIRMCAEKQKRIREVFKERLTKKHKRRYKQKFIDNLEAMDNLCFSPKTEENIQGIKIVLAI